MDRLAHYRRWKLGEDPHALAKEAGVTRERMRHILAKMDAEVPLVDRIAELERMLVVCEEAGLAIEEDAVEQRARAEAAEARVKVLGDALEWAYRGDGLDECSLSIQRLSNPFREPDGPDHAVQVGIRLVIDMIRARAALKGEK